MTELTQEQLAEIRGYAEKFMPHNESPGAVNADRRALLAHIDHQAERIAELEGKVALAKRGLEAVADLINDSDGCAGLHQNGDVAPWMELLTGGRFEEWLIHFDEAHRRLVVEDEA